MQTSAKGLDVLEHEEGVVLKAYRDVVGVWTIGAGLTAASGVVKPKPGMTITRDQATSLLQTALRQNYEPGVIRAMPTARQHEFDAAVSFHFNTGAIAKATWVRKWRAKAAPVVIRNGMLAWNKGGGKVLPGLTRRRATEAAMLLDAVYPAYASRAVSAPADAYAAWGLALSSNEKAAAVRAFAKLGYAAGTKLDAVLRPAVIQFQRDHDLTPDGIIGRATLSTLQRRLDAPRAAAKPAVAATLPAAAVTDLGTTYTDALGASDAGLISIGLVGVWAVSTAWRYRDVIAAKITRQSPRIAAILRSF